MRNILKLHSGTQSGTAISSKKMDIFDDFEKIVKFSKKIMPKN
jgi:hypothetical protein